MQAIAPAIRASYAKTVIASMKQRPAEERDRLLGRLDPGFRASVREYSLLDWMAAGEFARLPQLVLDTIGPARAKLFWRANLLSSLERTLLRPLRLGAMALYGKSPGSLLRMTPQAWELVSRNCGRCHTSELPDGMLLRFEGLPSEVCNPGMLLLWSGGSESCIERMKFAGHADAEFGPPGVAFVNAHWRASGS